MPNTRYSDGGIYLGPGIGGMQSETLPYDSPQDHAPADAGGNEAAYTGGAPHLTLIGVGGLILIMWFIRKQSAHLQATTLGINLFNLLTITLTAILGIVLLKVIFTKVPVPGVTNLVMAA